MKVQPLADRILVKREEPTEQVRGGTDLEQRLARLLQCQLHGSVGAAPLVASAQHGLQPLQRWRLADKRVRFLHDADDADAHVNGWLSAGGILPNHARYCTQFKAELGRIVFSERTKKRPSESNSNGLFEVRANWYLSCGDVLICQPGPDRRGL